MSIEGQLVEGWTERIEYQLTYKDKDTKQKKNKNLSGGTVALELFTSEGVPVTYAGNSGIINPMEGTVYFDPAATDLKAALSPYLVRWKFTDSSGKVSFYPSSVLRERWEVAK